jgi:hypothetical protein
MGTKLQLPRRESRRHCKETVGSTMSIAGTHPMNDGKSIIKTGNTGVRKKDGDCSELG